MEFDQNASKFKLIEDELPRLRRFARFLTGDVDYADDLVQECLVRAVDKIDSWHTGTNMRAWLFTILKNVLRNDARTTGRFVATDPQAEDGYLAVVVPAEQDARMALHDVQRAFLGLSGEHREVLTLVAIDGLSYEEASVVLDVPVGTVRSRLARARTTLDHAVNGEADQPSLKSAVSKRDD